MSYLLPHLHSGYAVDQAILSVRRAAAAARPPPRGALQRASSLGLLWPLALRAAPQRAHLLLNRSPLL
jgi:hypothetical protein